MSIDNISSANEQDNIAPATDVDHSGPNKPTNVMDGLEADSAYRAEHDAPDPDADVADDDVGASEQSLRQERAPEPEPARVADAGNTLTPEQKEMLEKLRRNRGTRSDRPTPDEIARERHPRPDAPPVDESGERQRALKELEQRALKELRLPRHLERFNFSSDYQDILLACIIRYPEQFPDAEILRPKFFDGVAGFDAAYEIQEHVKQYGHYPPSFVALGNLIYHRFVRHNPDRAKEAVEYVQKLAKIDKTREHVAAVRDRVESFVQERNLVTTVAMLGQAVLEGSLLPGYVPTHGRPAMTQGDFLALFDKAFAVGTSHGQALSWDDLLKPPTYADNLLGDRWLERGQGALLYAPAGVGKSVAALQACAEWSAGLPGLRITPARPLRIVIVQTEDSDDDSRENFRDILDADYFTAEQLALVKENLIVRAQACGGGPAKLESTLTQVARQYAPDLVLLNPLLAWCEGDPTRDLGKLLYQTLDPLLKRHRFALLAIHHTPKMNNTDTSSYGAFDHQYLAAGDARIANWPRGMIMIEPCKGKAGEQHVFCFRAAKRAMRTGWGTSEIYLKWGEGKVRWMPASPAEAEAGAANEHHRLLEVAPKPDAEGVSRERMHQLAREKIKVGRAGPGKHKVDDWLKLCIEDGLIERIKCRTASGREGALFRQTELPVTEG